MCYNNLIEKQKENVMKLVINKCFGGFGLSDKAYKRLIELNVKTLKNYDELNEDNENSPYIIKNDNVLFGSHYSNFAEKKNRSNKLLIQVVEEFGFEASSAFANLQIVEIPDDIEWDIDEYDGIETIHEAHQSW